MKSEPDNVNAPPVKYKFTPKVPSRRGQKPDIVKKEPLETKDDVVDKELLAKLNSAKSQEGFGRRKPKAERTAAPARVAFGYGTTSLARSYGKQKDDSDALGLKPKKEYVEPWDEDTYYPVTLPLRMPSSGDPEILDEEEFGEASASSTLDETHINPAKELGLTGTDAKPQMILFQFPSTLPFPKQPDTTSDSKGSGGKPDDKSKKVCSLNDLPAGYMGKMLVYKSGKIKMKLGDVLFDVMPGQNSVCAENAAVINVKEKHFCNLGTIAKHAVVTPDIDSLLENL